MNFNFWFSFVIKRSHPSGATNQGAALQAEGVTVNRNAMGELTVDFGEFGWFPRQLPSEVAAGVVLGDDDDDDDDDDESGEEN